MITPKPECKLKLNSYSFANEKGVKSQEYTHILNILNFKHIQRE